MVNKDFVRPLR